SECDIVGSSDSSIKNVVPTDIMSVIVGSDIKALFANGKTAEKLYNKYQKPLTGIDIIALPSTSPANASWSTARLTEEWRANIRPFL
ncbi:MAG: DNA-deoxyinosine glycosylase, partial [Ruminococcus sp.]|nr:DNA-deoxyinosine glycosylase [Ruminococcus sp.]